MDNISLTKSISISVLVLIASVFLVSCDGDDPPSVTPDDSSNTANLIASSDQLSTLSDFLNEADLAGDLDGVTVFAPTNAAFDSLPDGTLDNQIEAILKYHVLQGKVEAGDISNFQTAETLQGSEILLTTENGVTVNDGAVVIGADLESTDGIVHAIDSVLLPPSLRNATGKNIVEEIPNNFSTFDDAVNEVTRLNTILTTHNSATVFIPTDQAFNDIDIDLDIENVDEEDFNTFPDSLKDLKAEIITNHIVPEILTAEDIPDRFTFSTANGEPLFTTRDNGVKLNNKATVVNPDDAEAVNGIIHGIDEVLLPNKFINVTRVIDKNFNLEELYKALDGQDLADGLADKDTVTVLAPTNDAFEDADLSGFSDSEIKSILNFHVIASELLSSDIIVDAIENSEDGEITKTTANDEDLTFTLDGDDVLITVVDDDDDVVSQATVSTADLEGSNGVVHIIDGILVPASLQ